VTEYTEVDKRYPWQRIWLKTFKAVKQTDPTIRTFFSEQVAKS